MERDLIKSSFNKLIFLRLHERGLRGKAKRRIMIDLGRNYDVIWRKKNKFDRRYYFCQRKNSFLENSRVISEAPASFHLYQNNPSKKFNLSTIKFIYCRYGLDRGLLPVPFCVTMTNEEFPYFCKDF